MDNNEIQQEFYEFQTIAKDQQNKQKRKFYDVKYLARGSEGEVYLAKTIDSYYKNVNEVAIKIQKGAKAEIIHFYEKLQAQQNELEQNGQKEKSQIIRIFDLCQDNEQNLVIVMEIGQQDLYKYSMENKQQLDFQKKEQICLELAQAIKQLHQLGYIHRDIKPENYVNVDKQFKLIDFGLTRQPDDFNMTMNVGTRIFQAPEILDGDGQYSSSVDIWSLGCTFFEVFENKQLLDVKTYLEAYNLIKNHKKDQKHINNSIENLSISQEWKDLIKSMLHPDPKYRIDAENLVIKIQSFINVKNNNLTNQQPICGNNGRLLTPQIKNGINQQGNWQLNQNPNQQFNIPPFQNSIGLQKNTGAKPFQSTNSNPQNFNPTIFNQTDQKNGYQQQQSNHLQQSSALQQNNNPLTQQQQQSSHLVVQNPILQKNFNQNFNQQQQKIPGNMRQFLLEQRKIYEDSIKKIDELLNQYQQ